MAGTNGPTGRSAEEFEALPDDFQPAAPENGETAVEIVDIAEVVKQIAAEKGGTGHPEDLGKEF